MKKEIIENVEYWRGLGIMVKLKIMENGKRLYIYAPKNILIRRDCSFLKWGEGIV